MGPANDVPALSVLGNRPLLDHDPLLSMARAPHLREISVQAVLDHFLKMKLGDGTPRL
jgi:hypothetical protein